MLVVSLEFDHDYEASSSLTWNLPALAPAALSYLQSPGQPAPGSGVPDGVIEAGPGDWKRAVSRRAAAALGLAPSTVSARIRLKTSQPRGTFPSVPVRDPVKLTVVANDPDRAQAGRLARAFVSAYVGYRAQLLERGRASFAVHPTGTQRRLAFAALVQLERSNVVPARAAPRVAATSPHPLRNSLLAAVLGAWAGVWLWRLRSRAP